MRNQWDQLRSGFQAKLPYLSLSVDSNNSSCCLVLCSNKNGLSTDPVHVDTGASFQVIQVDVAILCYEEHHIVLVTDLQNRNRLLKFGTG